MAQDQKLAMAKAIAAEIQRRAGGRVDVWVDDAWRLPRLNWRYDCPCGEVSGYTVMVDYEPSRLLCDAQQFYRLHVEEALELMRVHVRGEGNEPSF